jgi:hypothetical protein
MEATWFPEAPFDFPRTTGRYSPEFETLYNHSCENLKSDLFNVPNLVSQSSRLRHKLREESEVIQKSLVRLGDWSSSGTNTLSLIS